MPLAHFYKATFSGTLDGNEIFAHSQHFSSDSALASYVAGNLSSHITNLLATAVVAGPVATMAAAFADWVSWEKLHVEPIGTDGKLLPGGLSFDLALTDVGTGNGSLGLPYQCSHAVTLRNATIGRRNKNRFYLPPYVTGATNGKGIIGSPICTALGSWLSNQNTALQSLSPAISMVNLSVAGAAFTDVIDAYIGNVVDTQRRRRNHIPEVRTITAV